MTTSARHRAQRGTVTYRDRDRAYRARWRDAAGTLREASFPVSRYGTKTAAKVAAYKHLDAQVAQAASGLPATRRTMPTLAEWSAEWATTRRVSDSAKAKEAWALARAAAILGADTPVDRLGHMAVAQMAATLEASSPSTRWEVVRVLKQMLAAAVLEGLRPDNPVAGMKNPQPRAGEVEPFTVAEVDAVEAELGAVYGPAARLAAELGLRPEELFGLERGDFDRATNTVTLRRVAVDGELRPKGKTPDSIPRVVPMTAAAWQAVDALPAKIGSPLLFTGPRGGVLNLRNWRNREWYPALEAAGVARRGPYALRHTYATEAIASRAVDHGTLAALMGTSIAMLERTYVHHKPETAQAAAAGMAAWREAQRKAARKAAEAAGEEAER
jgi:integrase